MVTLREMVTCLSLFWRRLMSLSLCTEAVSDNMDSLVNLGKIIFNLMGQAAGIEVKQQELASSHSAFACFSTCDATLYSDTGGPLTKERRMSCRCSTTYTTVEIYLIPSVLWSLSKANSIK